MTILVYEYDYIIPATGEPVEPPQKRTAGLSLNAAFGLSASTRAIRITTTADCYIRISIDGSAATTADTPLAAGDVLQAPIAAQHDGRGVQVYATS